MYIIVAYKSDLHTVWRPCRNLLRSAVRKFFQLMTADCVYVVYRLKRTAVYTFCLSLNKHTLSVRRHNIAVKFFYFLSHGVVYVKKDFLGLPCAKRTLQYLLFIVTYPYIHIRTVNRINAADCLGCKLTASYITNGYFLQCRHIRNSHKQCNTDCQ